VLMKNVEAVREWFKKSGPERGLALDLDVRHDFQLLERTEQPTLPGPITEALGDWESAVVSELPRRIPRADEVMLEGHERIGFPQKRLRVLS